MRPNDLLDQAILHSALTNVLPAQHHLAPYNIETSNTSLSVDPLPGGLGIWDISVDIAAQAVVASMRSVHSTEMAGAMAGLVGVFNRSSIEAAVSSLGGQGTLITTAYGAIYTKASGSLYLSHKIFDSSGDNIALTDAYLTLTSPSTRVLRTTWTNFSAGTVTLNVWASFLVLI
jgi:hypothetical protein